MEGQLKIEISTVDRENGKCSAGNCKVFRTGFLPGRNWILECLVQKSALPPIENKQKIRQGKERIVVEVFLQFF